MPTRPKTYRRPPGRPPKHGGRALARYLRRNLLDRRSWVSREAEAIQEALAGDEGGLDRLSAAQASLLPVLASEALVLGAGWNQVLRRLADKKDIESLGVTKWLLTLANTYQRHLLAFRELRGTQKDEPLNLGEYLAAHTADTAAEDAPDAPADREHGDMADTDTDAGGTSASSQSLFPATATDTDTEDTANAATADHEDAAAFLEEPMDSTAVSFETAVPPTPRDGDTDHEDASTASPAAPASAGERET